MAVPYTFGSATSSIPLSQLDSNFATTITIGNTAVQLGNTVTTLNNMTLANVTISSGNVTVTNVSVTTANATTANITNSIITTGETLSYGTANGVAYLNTSKVVTTGSALTFDGTNFATTGTASAAKLIPTGSSATGNGMYLPAANSVGISTNGTNAVYIDSSQNVGIGTSSPSQKLEVYATANSLQIESVVRNDQAGTGVAAIGFNVSSGAASETSSTKAGIGLVRQNSYGVGSLCFYNNGTTSAGNFTTSDERMRIDSSGKLLIGTSGGIGESATNLVLYNASGSGAYSQQFFNSYSSGTSYFVEFLKRVSTTNTAVGTIQYNGTNVLYNTTSDVRLKKNIVDAPSALGLISQIKIRSFDWKDSDVHVDYGVVAQEVFEVSPSCVSQGDDGQEIQNTWGIDTSILVPALIKAIQEQQALITSLTTRLTALENK